MKRIFSLFALIIIFTAAAFADVRFETPKPTEAPKQTSKEAGLVIARTYKVDEPVLVIKKEMFEKLRASVDGKQTSALNGSFDFDRTQTIISGLFLSLAFVFGGVWLARNRGKVSKSTVGIVVFALIGMTTTFVTANVRAPRNVGFSSILSSEMSVDNAYAEGKIKVIIGDGVSGNDIELLFPRKTSSDAIKKEE